MFSLFLDGQISIHSNEHPRETVRNSSKWISLNAIKVNIPRVCHHTNEPASILLTHTYDHINQFSNFNAFYKFSIHLLVSQRHTYDFCCFSWFLLKSLSCGRMCEIKRWRKYLFSKVTHLFWYCDLLWFELMAHHCDTLFGSICSRKVRP